MARNEVLDEMLRAYVGPDGQIRWPEDGKERLEICLALLGFKVARSYDYWIDWATEKVDHPSPTPEYRRQHHVSERDQPLRDALAPLNEAQRRGVARLLAQTLEGLLHSVLVDLDRLAVANPDLVFHERGSSKVLASLRGDSRDFQMHLFDWLERFSERAHLAKEEEPRPPQPYELRIVTAAEEWEAYHELRRKVLWEARGRGDYDRSHPDEKRPGHFPHLLIHRGDAVGVVRIDVEGTEAILRRVAIGPEVQRRGHGRRLLALAEDFARAKGCTRVISHVAEDAVGFYEKCGYRRLGDPASSSETIVGKELHPA
jgi:ribosomal protein S18 acetylase RimI-like enzyme